MRSAAGNDRRAESHSVFVGRDHRPVRIAWDTVLTAWDTVLTARDNGPELQPGTDFSSVTRLVLPQSPQLVCLCLFVALLPTTGEYGLAADGDLPARRPNVLWIVVEDASPHVGCYGETTINTPHIDRLAEGGIRFQNAIVTSPVCSPSRSAIVTGIYPTTLGAHNHRSQRTSGKGSGNRDYYDSYDLPVRSVPDQFRKAGYYVTNSGLNKAGKTDYNFVAPGLYDAGDWKKRRPGQPFFAQVQLYGGKARSARADQPVDPDRVTLPPYYPDHPVLRSDWAAYLNSWIRTDSEVGRIVERLRAERVLDQTAIFFWTDHGVSHVRGKQFLYDEGIRVPLIVKLPGGHQAGTVREDLAEHIDVAAMSLTLAGIDVPESVQGRDLLDRSVRPRKYAFAARDRCDETVDIIRCVRTERWKYIRNFLSHQPHAQSNQYKDGKAVVRTMRQLYHKGALNELQARVFQSPRPPEELYDLENDPHETVDLAGVAEHQDRLKTLRGAIYDWMVTTRDVGLIPEPILEELGRRYGSKYHVLQHDDNSDLVRRLIQVIEAGQQGDRASLLEALSSDRASIRYWAAIWLGNLQDDSVVPQLAKLTSDPSVPVRVAAALALCRLGQSQEYVSLLAQQIESDNLITGMYAIRALEQVGPSAKAVLPAIRKARENPYEFTRRFARRMTSQLDR